MLVTIMEERNQELAEEQLEKIAGGKDNTQQQASNSSEQTRSQTNNSSSSEAAREWSKKVRSLIN